MGCWSATPVFCYLQSSMFKSKKDFYPNWCSNNSSETEHGCHAVSQLHVYKKAVYNRSLKVVLTINLMENSLLIKIYLYFEISFFYWKTSEYLETSWFSNADPSSAANCSHTFAHCFSQEAKTRRAQVPATVSFAYIF